VGNLAAAKISTAALNENANGAKSIIGICFTSDFEQRIIVELVEVVQGIAP
jgi:hypothetical protein